MSNEFSLGDRMKIYESVCDYKLNPYMHYIVRLDGKGFSKMTKRWPLQKPFDDNFNKAMHAATLSLFGLIPNIQLAWHGSDEISIMFIFPTANNMYFQGRIQKIISLASSAAAVNFNRKLNETLGDQGNNYALFDARIMQFPNITEGLNCFLFRQQDCIRNSISGYAQSVASSKKLHGLNSTQQLEILTENGIDWNNAVPSWSKYGTFIKRSLFQIESEDRGAYVRSDFVVDTFKANDTNKIENFIGNSDDRIYMTEKEWKERKDV